MASLLALSASGAEAGADTGGGLPQLNLETYPSQIFWLLVTLVVLYYLLSKIALPRIASVLEERADTIADDLDAAEEYRRKAQEAEAAYEQALADARSKALGIAAETRDAIQAQVNDAMAKADAEISARAAEGEKRIAEIRESSKVAVQEVAEETSVAVVEAVMPGVADPAALKAAVASRMGG
ncbi:MAG: F0F1 ATP synthase subunit B' [Pseudomonadota bacterium]